MSRRLLNSARSRGRQEFLQLQRQTTRQFTTSEWRLAESENDDNGNGNSDPFRPWSQRLPPSHPPSSSSPSWAPPPTSSSQLPPRTYGSQRSQAAASEFSNMLNPRPPPAASATGGPASGGDGAIYDLKKLFAQRGGLQGRTPSFAGLGRGKGRGGGLGLALPPRQATFSGEPAQGGPLGNLGAPPTNAESNNGMAGSTWSNLSSSRGRGGFGMRGGPGMRGGGGFGPRDGRGRGGMMRGRSRGRGRGGRFGGEEGGPRRRRRDGEEDDEESGEVSRWDSLEADMKHFMRPETAEEYEYVERRERALVEPFNPTLTLESLVEHAPALAVDSNPWGKYGTALANLRLIGGSRPYEVEGSFAPQEMGRLLRRENLVFLTDPAKRDEYRDYVEQRRDEVAEKKGEDRLALKPYVVPGADDAVREAIDREAIRGEYEAPRWAPIQKPVDLARTLSLKSESYTPVDVEKLQAKIVELMAKSTVLKPRPRPKASA